MKQLLVDREYLSRTGWRFNGNAWILDKVGVVIEDNALPFPLVNAHKYFRFRRG
jgi:hypothetical protein